MQILKADVLGMCFGVRDALAMIEGVSDPATVTIRGELVHNETVLRRLDQLGFVQEAENRRRSLPTTDAVLVTAHGVSDRERSRLLAAGKTILDSTCPLVTRAHDAAQTMQSEDRHVLVIGQPGHVEVQGIIEDLASYTLVPGPSDVTHYPFSRLGVMCQTTTPVAHARAVVAEVRRRNPDAEIRFIDTICHPTKDHLDALERLLDVADCVVVVGGQNSNNTKQLVRRCTERGVDAFHVQGPENLRGEWFADARIVGLTAGTSTLAETIDAVERALKEIAATL